MFATRKFQHTLNLVLALFTGVICLAYSAAMLWGLQQTEDHIVNNTLRGEFRRFEQRYQALSPEARRAVDVDFAAWLAATPPLPPGFSVHSKDDAALPEFARGLSDGIWDVADIDTQTMVGRLGPNRLILLLDETQIFEEDRLEKTVKLWLFLFSLFLIVLSFGVSLLIAKRIASPIIRLNHQLKGSRPDPPFHEEQRHDEIGELARSFSEMVQRLNGFLAREKMFTRHASHELRTPIAIIANSLSVLRLPNISPEKSERNLARIHAAVQDMNDLINAFLALGREQQAQTGWAWIEVDLAVLAALEKLAPPGISPSLSFPDKPVVWAEPALFNILLENLLKNALNHGGRQLRICAEARVLTVTNDLVAPAERTEGFGFGLEIVDRVVDRLGWRFENEQTAAQWRATLYFTPKP